MENIEVNIFNLSSIENMVSTLEKKREKYDASMKRAVRNLTKSAYEYMKSLVPSETGGLRDSIVYFFDEASCTGTIRVGASYALFVEYGTGIVGAQNPHPEPDGWQYDVNGHGTKGWWYYDPRQERSRWTRGQAAKAFVYKTARYIKENAPVELRRQLGVWIE